MSHSVVVNIKGGKPDSNRISVPVTLEGSSCRVEDFLMAFIQFANEWNEQHASEPKPCDCQNK
jgi:hypothetical protein